MVQSVELVLDETLDAAVRAEWQVLAAAGLPSQAHHTGASNAPHVTLGVADRIDTGSEERLAGVPSAAGLPIRLGGLLVFSHRSHVLSRLVVPSRALLGLHEAVDAVLPGPPWTPHVTLARRLDDTQLAEALGVLRDRAAELVGTVRAVRRWDSERRVTWEL